MALRFGIGGPAVLQALRRYALAVERLVSDRDRLADHHGAGAPAKQAAPIEIERLALGRIGQLHRLPLIARLLFLHILRKGFIVVPKHLGLALDVELLGTERTIGRALRAAARNGRIRSLNVVSQLRFASVGHARLLSSVLANWFARSTPILR